MACVMHVADHADSIWSYQCTIDSLFVDWFIIVFLDCVAFCFLTIWITSTDFLFDILLPVSLVGFIEFDCFDLVLR